MKIAGCTALITGANRGLGHAFVEALRGGADLVMCNRFRGGIEPGAMPFLHRYLGNPVLSQLGRLFFNAPVGDLQCGLRGFNPGCSRRRHYFVPGSCVGLSEFLFR